MNIGVISDTHGLLRPQALDALARSDLILHAGDIGSPAILDALSQIAPLVAVRGNIDKGAWAEAIPERAVIDAEGIRIYLLHDLKELDCAPAAEGFRLIVSGHSHQPKAEEQDGVVYLNPGSAGPRRFKLPICIARVRVVGADLSTQIIALPV